MSRHACSIAFMLLVFTTAAQRAEAVRKPVCGETPGDRAAIATVQATAATACPRHCDEQQELREVREGGGRGRGHRWNITCTM